MKRATIPTPKGSCPREIMDPESPPLHHPRRSAAVVTEDPAVWHSGWATSRRKRCFDLAVAYPTLVLSLPVMAAIACVIKLTSRGPVLFRQTRVGMGQVPFVIYKFRTMVDDAESCGPSVTRCGDPRLTRAGRLLRSFKMDELPQLYNVLRGEMSFVGPRPKLPAHEQTAMLGRPGITGAATLIFAREEEILVHVSEEDLETFTVNVLNAEKKRLDEFYFREASLTVDLKIIAKTLLRVGSRRFQLDPASFGLVDLRVPDASRDRPFPLALSPAEADTGFPAQPRRRSRVFNRIASGLLLAFLMLPLLAQGPSGNRPRPAQEIFEGTSEGSTYIPLDSWIYPAVLRLYSLGYLPSTFIGMRPWTRNTVLQMLDQSREAIADGSDEQAQAIYESLRRELNTSSPGGAVDQEHVPQLDTVYTRLIGIGGPVLNDSFHLGQTIVNDYGRPYQTGFNNVTGYSSRAGAGRFTTFMRAEFQHSPSADGYTPDVAATLAAIDRTPDAPQSTIPLGPIASRNQFRILEVDASARLLNHEVSFGKTDAWLGPGVGGGMAWSNNAEDIYAFRINRVEPLHIPGLSRVIGPAKYDFMVGKLQGHGYPNAPWIHSEKFSFKPTENLEFGFQRSVIWGGKGHVPITVGTFLRSFFSTTAADPSVKFSRDDPGARFSSFDFTYRLPYLRRWATIYCDSTVHDDVFPISAPGRAGIRPGVYLAQIPGLPRLDLRAEATSTDPPDRNSVKGEFLYWESVQLQGYTNKGFLIGDWIGREGKGGDAWLTWHLSGNQLLQAEYRNAKVAKDFVPGGTTQHDISLRSVLRPNRDLELNALAQVELWNAPLLRPGQQRNFLGSLQLTYYPHRTLSGSTFR